MSFSFGKSVPATSMNFGGGGGFSGGQNSFLSTAGQSLASSVPPATMPPSFLNPVTTPSTVTSGTQCCITYRECCSNSSSVYRGGDVQRGTLCRHGTGRDARQSLQRLDRTD